MIIDFVNWNLSRNGRALSQSNAFVVSFPKSGRTWLRVLYFSYLANISGKEFCLDSKAFPKYPKVTFTHDRWQHQFLPGVWDFIRGRHLIPPAARQNKKIILLARDPRDVVVSLYFHLSKRPNVFGWTPEPMSRMIRNPRFGLPTIITLMNRWIAEWDGELNFKMLRYEDLHAQTLETFRDFIEFIDLSPIDDDACEAAVDFATFDNMRAMENDGCFNSASLMPGDRGDADSFKTRRGKVHGFFDYFDESDLAFASSEMTRLNPLFGYQSSVQAPAGTYANA